MFKVGKTIRINNDAFRLQQSLGAGGNGEVWAAIRKSNSEPVAIKVLFSCNEDDIWRIQTLKEYQITGRLQGAACIEEVKHPRGKQDWAGYVMPLAMGVGLDEWLEQPEFNILDNLFIAIQITKILDDAHQLEICHGDIHPRNIRIFEHNGVVVVTLIDWDNAVLPGLPDPQSIGVKRFLAPETMEAFVDNKYIVPDLYSERCSVAKVLHWLFFMREAYHTSNEREFEQATIEGIWNSDPAQGPVDAASLGGITNLWVTSEVADLFRRSVGRDRESRPSMSEWLESLLKVFKQGIPFCKACQGPLLSALRTHCPYCGNPFPTLAAVTAGNQRFVANGTPVLIGRDVLASPSVSLRHAVISKLGPETFITDLASKNGTYLGESGRWIKIPGHQQCPLHAGDRVRCGNIELKIVNA